MYNVPVSDQIAHRSDGGRAMHGRSAQRATRWGAGIALLALAIGVTGCGGDDTSSVNVPSLGGSSTTAKSATSTTVNPEEAAQEFVACLRDQGLDVADPQMNSDGSVDMRSIFESANIQPGSEDGREAMDACRDKLANAGFGPSAEEREARQEAMLAFTACLRGEGLTVSDVDFAGPGGPRPGGAPGDAPAGTSGSSGAQANSTGSSAGSSGGLGPVSGAVGSVGGGNGDGGPQGPRGPMSAEDRQARLAEMLGLDASDSKVAAAFEACSDKLEALGAPGQRDGSSTTTTTKG